MYEKPQYFTKDGFKRLPKNPHKDASANGKLLPLKIKRLVAAIPPNKKVKKDVVISDEAARLIAGVLKGMLNTPRK